jgi:NarL family two-component system response regulator LiaR
MLAMGADVEVKRIKVLLVDDNQTFRNTTRQLLLTTEDIEVVGEAGGGQESLEEVERLRPDVVLMDCLMPGMDGAEATRQMHQLYPDIKVVALSLGADPDSLNRMLAAGVEEILIKGVGPQEIGQAIRQATTDAPQASGERR